MEENRRISWSDLFIKIILVILFVLFTVWLLSLSNKDISNSLDVLTDNMFVQNIDRMKEVGKSYFTTERLPKKVGEIETLTLEEMYEKKLILEVKDKYGNACDAEDSYVSIEKLENEYQMKVNLECGDEEDYIIVIMGCYDYCDTDICEKEEETKKEIEYEYKKTIGGRWSDYGKWSEWSKVSVTKTNYREVETKIVTEEYSYDKTVTSTLTATVITNCPDGYSKTSDGTKCYKNTSTYEYIDPVCPTVSGYTLTGRTGFTCNYSKTTTSNSDPVCPTVSGYTLTGRTGFTCNYSKTTTSTADPVCPTVSGYTLTGRTGFTCNYSKTTTSTADPVCPTLDGWSVTRSGFTCNYSRTYQVAVGKQLVSTCSGCAAVWQTIYETRTETKTDTASCPSGYSQSGTTCAKSATSTTTKTASCPSGYSKSGTTCVKSTTSTTTKTASCPSGYSKSGTTCVKTKTSTSYKDLVKSCSSGYKLNSDKSQCYKVVTETVKETGTRDVTYYRYRVREYIGGSVDYKWSKSKEDKELLNAGYVLTGRTR